MGLRDCMPALDTCCGSSMDDLGVSADWLLYRENTGLMLIEPLHKLLNSDEARHSSPDYLLRHFLSEWYAPAL